MDAVTTVALWIACTALLVVGLAGGASLIRGKGSRTARRRAWAQVLMALWGALALLPRLLGVGSLVALVLAVVGLVPMFTAIALLRHAREDGAHSPTS